MAEHPAVVHELKAYDIVPTEGDGAPPRFICIGGGCSGTSIPLKV